MACLYVMNRIFPISISEYMRKTILPLALITILSPIAGYYITQTMEESFLRMIIVGITSVVICVLLSYMVALQKEERKNITTFIIKKIRK